MFIRLNSDEIRAIVDRWCRVEGRFPLSDIELYRFLGEVESILCMRLTRGLTANLYNVLADEPALDEPKVERILKLVVNR